MAEALLSVQALSCHYEQAGQRFAAVDSVSFDMVPGEVLGLVGESGSGKSTIGRLIVGLAPRSQGAIILNGQPLPARLRARDYRQLANQVQMVFQDNYSAMNPRMRVLECTAEPLVLRGFNTTEAKKQAMYWLERVGLGGGIAQRFPHELSGGQRQRVGIARALINRPKLLICDEPVSALDVSVQAQIVNLLRDIQEQEQLALLFIAHDLAVVNFIAERNLVMYRGRLLEQGGRDMFRRPAHPYTETLMKACPVADPEEEKRREIQRQEIRREDRPEISEAGCSYADRCPYRKTACLDAEPSLQKVAREGQVACFYPLNQD